MANFKMSVFDPTRQNGQLETKIAAGLSKLAEVLRVLLWDQAKQHGLSPIQIQILVFVHHHANLEATVSELAREFTLTKPTISDAVKSLEAKGLIAKHTDAADTRSYAIKLTATGRKLVKATDGYADMVATAITPMESNSKVALWNGIAKLIEHFATHGIIQPQRMCYHCKHYQQKANGGYCALIRIPLKPADVRLDCPEFESV
jgi:DNA-binding MarR family transcriptional regulator